MNKILINEQYGDIDMPSQIADSFQHSREYQASNQNSTSPIKYNHGYDHDDSNLKYSKYVDERDRRDIGGQEDQINLSSSLQDTFLANLPILLANKSKPQPQPSIPQPQPDISLNKTHIQKSVLPNEQVTEYIQIINSSSNPIILTVSSPAQIQIISSQGYQKNYQYLGTLGTIGVGVGGGIGGNLREFYFQAWQKMEIGFRIGRSSEEIGDIFQTICLETRLQKSQKECLKKRQYIQVQIHYITPKLKITYQGNSDVTTISLNKVSINRIAKNKFGEYSLMLGASGLERFECTLEARGEISVFPSQVILYKEEMKKINFKSSGSGSGGNGRGNRGAVVIRAKNAKVSFVFGVQLV